MATVSVRTTVPTMTTRVNVRASHKQSNASANASFFTGSSLVASTARTLKMSAARRAVSVTARGGGKGNQVQVRW